MRRFAHCLILVLTPSAAVWADDAFNHSQRGACVYSESKSANTPPLPLRATATRSSPLGAAHAANTASARQNEGTGGGGSEDDLMQRMRAPRWHSFLPGMFR